jgi:hypothetical protein
VSEAAEIGDKMGLEFHSGMVGTNGNVHVAPLVAAGSGVIVAPRGPGIRRRDKGIRWLVQSRRASMV